MRFVTHDTAVKAAKWCGLTIVFNCIVELILSAHPFLQAMSYLLWMAGTWMIVSKHIKENPGLAGQSLEDVLLETECDRMCLIPDIDNVFFDSGYTWCWPDAQSITDLVVTDPDGKRWHGSIQMDSSNRVYAVSCLIEGKTVRFVNKPYLYPKKERLNEDNKPINSFFKDVLPDATWSWAGEDILSVTSAEKNWDAVLVKVHYRKDGHTVSSMIGTEEKVRLVRSAKKATKKHDEKEAQEEPSATERNSAPSTAQASNKPAEPAIAPAPIEGVERDGNKSVLTAPEREPAVAETEPLESNLLQVDEVPPLSTETVKMSAENMAMFISAELEELANAALDEGDDSFLYKWPEGIQTQIEAEYLAKELLSRCDIYKDITVDGDNRTLKISLLV